MFIAILSAIMYEVLIKVATCLSIMPRGCTRERSKAPQILYLGIGKLLYSDMAFSFAHAALTLYLWLEEHSLNFCACKVMCSLHLC